MPLTVISEKAGVRKVYKAGEGISQHAVVYLSDAEYVKEADNTHSTDIVGVVEGVVSGGVASGDPVRVLYQGVTSGAICRAAVEPGDKVTGYDQTSGAGLASGKGKITPFDTITPVLSGTAIGTALTSGGVGSGIQLLVHLAG